MAIAMRHMIILLPGIMGSVLEQEGVGQVWGLSGQALWTYLRTLGGALQSLPIQQEDITRDKLDDGIRATQLIQDLHSIPFVMEHAGYSTILRRLPEHFDVTQGSPVGPADEPNFQPREDANFFPFPYDWRRDNRVAARRLKQFIDTQLPRWRAWSGADDAQVILIGHSLGGLIARHYVEVLEGWRNCLALFTIGSPHSGALGALAAVSQGVHKAFIDFSAVMRTFPSAYQILPTDKVVEVSDDAYTYVAVARAIPNLDRARATAARTDFLVATREAARVNQDVAGYEQRLIPWAGTRQATLQSAIFRNGQLQVLYDQPRGVDASLADGDGTVPRISAIPDELRRAARFAVERHGWLTNNDMTLQPLLDTIVEVAAAGTQGLRGATETERPTINLRLEPVYDAPDPVMMQVTLAQPSAPTLARSQPLRFSVKPVGAPGDGAQHTATFVPGQTGQVAFEKLPPGLYQLTVGPAEIGPALPAPVHGAFEVVAADAQP